MHLDDLVLDCDTSDQMRSYGILLGHNYGVFNFICLGKFLSSRNGSSLKGVHQLFISVVGTLAVLEHTILVAEVLER